MCSQRNGKPNSGDSHHPVESVTKIYGSGDTAVRALDRLSVEVQQGEFVAVMGPSGCGKSTLLNMLGALDQPSEGKVWVAGEDLSELKDVDRFRAQTVGFVFQLHNLLPTMTAQENVEVPLQGQVNSRKERRARSATCWAGWPWDRHHLSKVSCREVSASAWRLHVHSPTVQR